MLLSSINLIGATALIAKHANNYSPQKMIDKLLTLGNTLIPSIPSSKA